jgi:hypothetical protein
MMPTIVTRVLGWVGDAARQLAQALLAEKKRAALLDARARYASQRADWDTEGRTHRHTDREK